MYGAGKLGDDVARGLSALCLQRKCRGQLELQRRQQEHLHRAAVTEAMDQSLEVESVLPAAAVNAMAEAGLVVMPLRQIARRLGARGRLKHGEQTLRRNRKDKATEAADGHFVEHLPNRRSGEQRQPAIDGRLVWHREDDLRTERQFCWLDPASLSAVRHHGDRKGIRTPESGPLEQGPGDPRQSGQPRPTAKPVGVDNQCSDTGPQILHEPAKALVLGKTAATRRSAQVKGLFESSSIVGHHQVAIEEGDLERQPSRSTIPSHQHVRLAAMDHSLRTSDSRVAEHLAQLCNIAFGELRAQDHEGSSSTVSIEARRHDSEHRQLNLTTSAGQQAAHERKGTARVRRAQRGRHQ